MFPEFEWYAMNFVFSWKQPLNRCSWPGLARQGFVTSTIWQEICSWKDQPIFPLLYQWISLQRFNWSGPPLESISGKIDTAISHFDNGHSSSSSSERLAASLQSSARYLGMVGRSSTSPTRWGKYQLDDDDRDLIHKYDIRSKGHTHRLIR